MSAMSATTCSAARSRSRCRRMPRVPIRNESADVDSSLRGDAGRRVPVDDPLTRSPAVDWSYTMSTFLWIFFATLYMIALVVLGVTTLRKGHVWLFVLGIFLPFLWIAGRLMAPARGAAGTA